MTALSVNINKVALIRNSRKGENPNLIEYASACINAGADGITVHPRPDQRHVKPSDLPGLKELINKHTNIEFNIEGNPFEEAKDDYLGLLELVKRSRPHQCTLVPDSTDQLTSDHGFDLNKNQEKVYKVVRELRAHEVRSSLFLDPDLAQIRLASEIGVDRVELYTGPYAESWGKKQFNKIFDAHKNSASLAQSLNVGVNAGHDLNLTNIKKYVSIPNILEVSIGHALTVESLYKGLDNTIRKYKSLISPL